MGTHTVVGKPKGMHLGIQAGCPLRPVFLGYGHPRWEQSADSGPEPELCTGTLTLREVRGCTHGPQGHSQNSKARQAAEVWPLRSSPAEAPTEMPNSLGILEESFRRGDIYASTQNLAWGAGGPRYACSESKSIGHREPVHGQERGRNRSPGALCAEWMVRQWGQKL